MMYTRWNIHWYGKYNVILKVGHKKITSEGAEVQEEIFGPRYYN